jgi:hypothetical protein
MWNKTTIQALIDTNDRAAVKGLIAIYRLQTDSERDCKTTKDANGVGFSAFDAELCTDLAEKALRYGRLTDKQIALVRKKVRRYWRQLADIANEKGAPVPAAAVESVAHAASVEDAELLQMEIDRDDAAMHRMERDADNYDRSRALMYETGLVRAGDTL